MFKVTRQEILDASRTLIGVPFVHQGRSAETGVDCVGLLVVMGRTLGYPDIVDVEGYRRIPSSTVIREVLSANMDEIPLADAGVGDVFLMRNGGLLPRHAAIYFSAESDAKKGTEPMILHAVSPRVRLDPVSAFPPSYFVSAFRLRGLID